MLSDDQIESEAAIFLNAEFCRYEAAIVGGQMLGVYSPGNASEKPDGWVIIVPSSSEYPECYTVGRARQTRFDLDGLYVKTPPHFQPKQ